MQSARVRVQGATHNPNPFMPPPHAFAADHPAPPPSESDAGTSTAGWDGAAPSPTSCDWRTAASLIDRANATPRKGGLGSLLAAVGEEEEEEEEEVVEVEVVVEPRPPRPRRSLAAWLTAFADAGGGSVRNSVQLALGFALACLPSIVGPGWSPLFPGACTAPTFFLVAMLQMSPTAAVGVRLTSVAALIGPAVVGSLAGGGVVSAAAAAAPHPRGWAFPVLLTALAAPLVAVAAIVRSTPHVAPHVAGMGLILALAAGSTILGAASALTAGAAQAASGRPAPHVLHGHWWRVVAPTIFSFAVSGAATIAASLILPALASVDVEAVTGRALAGCGEALSHTAARLFAVAADPTAVDLARADSKGEPLPPAGAGAAALPPAPVVLVGGKDGAARPPDTPALLMQREPADAPALLMQREPTDAPAFEAWWARLCAPVDTPGSGSGAGHAGSGRTPPGLHHSHGLFESVLGGSRRRGAAAAAPPVPPPPQPPLKATGAALATLARPISDPGPPIGALRPLLGAARAALAAARVEPPSLRGCGARSFCPDAWARLLAAVDALVTALSALQAVAGDDTALSDTRQLYPPRLEGALREALASAVACLSALAARVDDAAGGAPVKCDALPGTDCWARHAADLRAAMAGSVEAYVTRARSAKPGAPVVLPSAYTARSHAFAYVASAAVVRCVADLDAAAAAALGCSRDGGDGDDERPHRPATGAWAVALAQIVLCLPVWAALVRAARIAWRKTIGRRRHAGTPASPRTPAAARRKPGPRPWRVTVAAVKYFATVWVALAACLAAIAGSPVLARLGPLAGLIAAALTASDKVEATLQKTGLWLVATAVGGLLGGALSSIPGLAASPPGIAAVLVAAAALVGAGARTGFRTAATLTLLTLASIALCEVSGSATQAACASAARGVGPRTTNPWCGLAGGTGVVRLPVWTAVAGRAVAVAAGVLLAQAICVLAAPWYVSDWACAVVGAAVRDGAEPFMEAQALRFVRGGRAAWVAAADARGQALDADGGGGGDEETPAARPRPIYGLIAAMPAPLPPSGFDPLPLRDQRGRPLPASDPAVALQVAVAAPLVEAQAALARDATAWDRGVLSTPPSVRTLLRSALALLDALAALSFALDPAIVSGGEAAGGGEGLTGILYEAYVCSSWDAFRSVFGSLRAVVGAAADHLVTVHAHSRGWTECVGRRGGKNATAPPGGPRSAKTRAALQAALADLAAKRRASIGAQAQARREYHAAMAAAPDAGPFFVPRDITRHLAFMMALIKCSNRVQGVAAAALAL